MKLQFLKSQGKTGYKNWVKNKKLWNVASSEDDCLYENKLHSTFPMNLNTLEK